MVFNNQNPKMVLYVLGAFKTYNDWMDFITKCNNNNVNVIILTFIAISKDNSGVLQIYMDESIKSWTKLTDEQRTELKNTFNGIIIVSHGGASFSSYIKNYDDYGQTHVADITLNFINKYNLDGVDIDYENIDGTMLRNFSITLANNLKKSPNKYFTMAPQASGGEICKHLDIYNEIPNLIDWMNIQLYYQTSRFAEYTYAMIDADDSPVATSLRGLMTGLKINKLRCGNVKVPCPGLCGNTKQIKLPSYKIVLGSIVKTEGGNVYVDIVTNFIKKASEDKYFTDWMKDGGMMVWCYFGNVDPKPKPEGKAEEENKNTLSSLKTVSGYFHGGKPPPVQNNWFCPGKGQSCEQKDCDTTKEEGCFKNDNECKQYCDSGFILSNNIKNILIILGSISILITFFLILSLYKNNNSKYKKYIIVSSLITFIIGILFIILALVSKKKD